VNQLWDKLINNLSEILVLYQAILAISKQKREILVAAKAQELETLTKREEILILQTGKLDAQRESIIQEIGTSFGLKPDDITLEKTKQLADPEMAKRLEALSSDFDKVLTELVPLNKTNTKLIQQALTYINYNINVLAQNTSGPTYAPKGLSAEKTTAPARVLFDAKV